MTSCCKSAPSAVIESVDTPATEEDRVYSVTIYDEIEEGQAVFVGVQDLGTADHFVIDFCLDDTDTDIALRVEIHLSTNKLIRNSCIRSVWGNEETAVPAWFRLVAGVSFELQMYFKVDCIKIAFANHHVASYVHRLPFNRIRSIRVCGAVGDVLVERKFIELYPEHRVHIPHVQRIHNHVAEALELEEQHPGLVPVAVAGTVARAATGILASMVPAKEGEPVAGTSDGTVAKAAGGASSHDASKYLPLPCFTTFSKTFFEEGCILFITGKVSLTPKMIRVTLQVGNRVSPPPIRAMQMDIRFKDRSNDPPFVTFRTFLTGNVSTEFNCHTENGLRPGGAFDLHIMRNESILKVYINTKHIYDYRAPINPLGVNTCGIEGDLYLVTLGLISDSKH